MKINKKLSILITLFVLSFFVWYFFAHIEEFESLLEVHPLYLAMIAVGHLVVLVTNGLFLRIILRAFGKDMTFPQSFQASLVTATGNLFLPAGGGSGVQAVFLKKSHDLSYKNFLSSLSGNYIIVFLLTSLLGIIALLMINSPASIEYITILVAFCIIFFVTLLMTIFGLPNKILSYNTSTQNFIARILSLIVEILKGWSLIAKSKRLVLSLLVISSINFLALLLISYFSLVGVGAQISFWGLVLYSCLGVMSLLVNVTPGALGIKEAIYIFSSTVIGITTPQIIGAAILDRGIKYIMLIIGWAWVRCIGYIHKRTELNENN